MEEQATAVYPEYSRVPDPGCSDDGDAADADGDRDSTTVMMTTMRWMKLVVLIEMVTIA